MSPQAQRIAIAEACGFSDVTMRANGLPECTGRKGFDVYAIPCFPTDLNAMHEAEKVLTTMQRAYYVGSLSELTKQQDQDDWYLLHATAAQRAEAFLRTIEKWEDV